MGTCCNKGNGDTADKTTANMTTSRRRLSVGNVEEDSSKGTKAAESKELEPNPTSIVELAKGGDANGTSENNGSGRRPSVTQSDLDMGKQQYSEKKSVTDGDEDVPFPGVGLGYTCRKGLKPEAPNQDSWSVLNVDKLYSIFGVYDGHGRTGHDVSNFVKEHLPKIIIQDYRFKPEDMKNMTDKTWDALLKESFEKMQKMLVLQQEKKPPPIKSELAGTTASVVVHDHVNDKITVSHVADSTVVLGSWDPALTTVTAQQLTRDHKPDLKDERARIEKAGGRVVFDGYANYRVYAKNGAKYPGLNMSRCLGDLKGHSDAGCSCEPEVKTIQMDERSHVLLLCSDGVWEFITPQEAIDIVCCQTKPYLLQDKNSNPWDDPMKGAENLAKAAWDRWIKEEGGAVVDDITVVLIFLKPKPSPAKGEASNSNPVAVSSLNPVVAGANANP